MQGIERIKILASEIKDKALLKIIDYLISREDMNDKYLNEEKSLKQMVDFIKNEAKKEAQNGMAMIEDEVVYGWAIHYFDETNENLKLSKCEALAKIQVEKEAKKENISISSTTTKKTKNIVPEGQLSLFD